MAAVLRCGKQMEKLPHYYFSWIVSSQKQRYICEMLPLETKQSGGKLLLHSDLRGWGVGSVSRGNIQQQVLQKKITKQRRNSTATRLECGM